MLRKLLYILLFFVKLGIIAQVPYELFNSKSVQFYGKYPFVTGSTIYLKGIKPDSVKLVGNDSIYYQFRTTTSPMTSTTCVNSRTPSWAGFVTKRRTNGDYIFYNSSNDSIVFKTQLGVGASWVYYTNPLNGNYLLATVSQKTFSPTYDIYSDTVKIISFQNYNSLSQPVYHYYNTQNFILSKTQGLIRCGAFLKFPSDSAIYNRCYGKLLKRMDVYNYNIGDEVHSQTNCYNSTTLLNTSWNSFLITSKVFVNPDSVFYTINKQTFSGTLSPVTSTTLSYGQLSKLVYKAMPEQTNLNASNNIELGYRIENFNNPCQRFVIAEVNANPPAVNGSDSCLIPNLVSPVAMPYTIEHVGAYSTSPILTGFYCNSWPAFTKISGAACGTPLTLALNVTNYNTEEITKVYPNPAINTLIIQTNDKINTIQIFDITGRIIVEQMENSSTINIESLEQGMYQLLITTSEGKNYSSKFIKE